LHLSKLRLPGSAHRRRRLGSGVEGLTASRAVSAGSDDLNKPPCRHVYIEDFRTLSARSGDAFFSAEKQASCRDHLRVRDVVPGVVGRARGRLAAVAGTEAGWHLAGDRSPDTVPTGWPEGSLADADRRRLRRP